MQLVDRDLLVGADGHDLLGEHVEAVGRSAQLLNAPGGHLGGGQHAQVKQVGQRSWRSAVPLLCWPTRGGRPGRRVAGRGSRFPAIRPGRRARPLPCRCRARARRSRRRHWNAPLLQCLCSVWWRTIERHAAVTARRESVAAELLVEPHRGERSDGAAVVREDDGRAVLLFDLAGQRAGRSTARSNSARGAGSNLYRAGLMTWRSMFLRQAGVDDGVRSFRLEPAYPPSATGGRCVAERPTQGSETGNCLRVLIPPSSRSTEGREESPALRARQGVDLVDDAVVLTAAENFTGPRRQQQVERLRSRDEDMGRLCQEPPPPAPPAACRLCAPRLRGSPRLALRRPGSGATASCDGCRC